MLLHHLCYASGLSEPGLPEGTLDQAKQRVDNFAAGFIKAGASAVIAEAYTSPSRYVAAILGSKRSIESLWRSSPTANGNTFAFASERSDGYVAMMDPGARDVRLRALDRPQGRAGVGRRPRRRPRLVAHDDRRASPTDDPGPPSLASIGLRLADRRRSRARRASAATPT